MEIRLKIKLVVLWEDNHLIRNNCLAICLFPFEEGGCIFYCYYS